MRSPDLSARRPRTRRLTALAMVAMAGCQTVNVAAPPPPVPGATRILFIGNSLTLGNDLPLLTRIIAEAGGEALDVRTAAVPGYGLRDHAVSGPALPAIRQGGWDIVVLQQGPSTLPESRVELVAFSEQFAEEIRAVGAEPALLMIWPPASRLFAFEDGSESYRAAAEAVEGYLFPASQAWLAAWRRDPDLPLYSADDFHPSSLGSILAALTVYGVVFDRPVSDLPERLTPTTSGLPAIQLDSATAAALYAAADEAIGAWGLQPVSPDLRAGVRAQPGAVARPRAPFPIP